MAHDEAGQTASRSSKAGPTAWALGTEDTCVAVPYPTPAWTCRRKRAWTPSSGAGTAHNGLRRSNRQIDRFEMLEELSLLVSEIHDPAEVETGDIAVDATYGV
jgi:hypothetical protein